MNKSMAKEFEHQNPLLPEKELKEIEGLINPLYVDQRGTESWERTKLIGEIRRLQFTLKSNDFWKDIVLTEEEKLNVDQVKRELEDFYLIMEEVPKVYTYITGDKLSKPNYDASVVIGEADEYQDQLFREYFQDEMDEFIPWLLSLKLTEGINASTEEGIKQIMQMWEERE
jgi:hypothetical protein